MKRQKSHRTPGFGSSTYKANFLWPYKDGTIEEAGYEFANAATEPYRHLWWKTLKARMKRAAQ